MLYQYQIYGRIKLRVVLHMYNMQYFVNNKRESVRFAFEIDFGIQI